MAADYTVFQTANTVFPVTTSLTNSLLLDCDATTYYMLDFFSWVIANEVGPRLVSANAAISGPITSAVAQRYPYSIEPYKLESGFNFPLLSISRNTTKFTKHSSSYYSDNCLFTVMYIFPPLTAAQAENLLPAFRAIEKSLRDRTVQGWDPGYTPPGGMQGDQPWAALYAHVQEIGIDDSEYGILTDSGDVGKLFPCLKMTFHVIERQNYPKAETPRTFAGGNIKVDVIAPDKTDWGTFVEIDTQLPPTFTSITAATGTLSGGTAVTIIGTLFTNPGSTNPGVQVLFGANVATNIVVVNSTHITCVTPAMSGAGVVDVTIINGDGQRVVAPSAFTFT